MSFVLEIDREILLKDSTVSTFYIPFNNGVYIYDTALLNKVMKLRYYGDEVNLLFWKSLNLNFGAVNPSLTIYTLITGYKYIYYYHTKEFKIYDSNNALIATRANITGIADLGIDFLVYMSHQFIIELDYADIISDFIFPAKLEISTIPSTINNDGGGISDDYIPCTPYPSPYNPSAGDYGRLGMTEHILSPVQLQFALYFMLIDTGINKADANLNQTAKYPFYFNILLNNGHVSATPISCYSLQDDMFVLPAFTMSLFPALMPVVRPGEVLNNRPVYEPWMIWGLYKFLYNKVTENTGDDYVVNTFDLSPNWH